MEEDDQFGSFFTLFHDFLFHGFFSSFCLEPSAVSEWIIFFIEFVP